MKLLKSKLAVALVLTVMTSTFLGASTLPVDAQVTSSTISDAQLVTEPEAGRYGRARSLAGAAFLVATIAASAAVDYLIGAQTEAAAYPTDALDKR